MQHIEKLHAWTSLLVPLFFLLFPLRVFAGASVATAGLPPELYQQAVMEGVVYDADYDYVALKQRQNVARLETRVVIPQPQRMLCHCVDRVVVYKKKHQMLLLKNDNVVRSYWIALSERPEGHKVYEGDKRTPEGTYILDYIKENSFYYKAFHISYPNPTDVARARSLGVRPGGMIMVHGQPPFNGPYHENIQRSNWTNGCIAILNPEIDEFISLVDPGTPIEIHP